MNGKPLAHSARPKLGIPAQPFWEHIERVTRAATDRAGRASAFWAGDRAAFCAEVETAARFHDCGKLAPENQAVLSRSCKERLPVRHEDGGVALLMEKQRDKAALLVAGHHAGLPSLLKEKAKRLQKPQSGMFRLVEAVPNTAKNLAGYAARYAEAGLAAPAGTPLREKWSGLAHRFALSCLVDADHGDTAGHYGEPVPKSAAACRWAERLEALDGYVEGLSAGRPEDTRNADRRLVYQRCRDADPDSGIVWCDAAVGSGKTTAVMAHLLRAAVRKGLRHIFVVLPYTNIIQQSVEVYRKALALPGENPAEVVAEVHHRAEFEDAESREMAVLWDAPVTVTTAVQFFETLAANKPARLRKLHELAGSAVFIDEAHAAIPIWMWPQTWLWLKELAGMWGCSFVLASGSLAKFWANADVVGKAEDLPDLLTPEIRTRLAKVEERRIQVFTWPEALDREELVRFVAGKPGPRLVILNTVQSTAVFADCLRTGGHDVLHLSTALAPGDREEVVRRIRARLRDRAVRDWTLVATSCVEAGVDFSFRTAFRESCSVASVIQTGGRVNRGGEWTSGEIWDVRLQDPWFNPHPAFAASRQVLEELLREGRLREDPSTVVTEALRRELVLRDIGAKAEQLRTAEALEEFPDVAEVYRVIDSDTHTVVVDPRLVERLENGERVPWRELLRGSVQIWARNLTRWRIRTVVGHEELYYWTAGYDPDFLGYMKGILPLIQGQDTGLYA